MLKLDSNASRFGAGEVELASALNCSSTEIISLPIRNLGFKTHKHNELEGSKRGLQKKGDVLWARGSKV